MTQGRKQSALAIEPKQRQAGKNTRHSLVLRGSRPRERARQPADIRDQGEQRVINSKLERDTSLSRANAKIWDRRPHVANPKLPTVQAVSREITQHLVDFRLTMIHKSRPELCDA